MYDERAHFLSHKSFHSQKYCPADVAAASVNAVDTRARPVVGDGAQGRAPVGNLLGLNVVVFTSPLYAVAFLVWYF